MHSFVSLYGGIFNDQALICQKKHLLKSEDYIETLTAFLFTQTKTATKELRVNCDLLCILLDSEIFLTVPKYPTNKQNHNFSRMFDSCVRQSKHDVS